MSDEKFTTKQKAVSNPLEELFDIEEETTLTEYIERTPSTLVKNEKYDDKDIEIEEQLKRYTN